MHYYDIFSFYEERHALEHCTQCSPCNEKIQKHALCLYSFCHAFAQLTLLVLCLIYHMQLQSIDTIVTTLISYEAYFGAPILHYKPLRAAAMISISITLPTFSEQWADSETLLQCKPSIFITMWKIHRFSHALHVCLHKPLRSDEKLQLRPLANQATQS